MHELAIARAVMAVVERHADGRPVERVDLRVGHLRQVVPSSLELAFQLVARGTVAEGAELALKHVPAAGVCRACGSRTRLSELPFACAACGGLDVDLTEGEELLVESLEVAA